MSLVAGLFETALSLSSPRAKGRPRQAKLRKAVSAAYYALFHQILQVSADSLVGTSAKKRKSQAWARVYRALNHKDVARVCRDLRRPPAASAEVHDPALVKFADIFLMLIVKREEADYDPNADFFKRDVQVLIEQAQSAALLVADIATEPTLDFVTAMLFGAKRA